MTDIDKYFTASPEEINHPRIRNWAGLIKDPSIKVECEIHRRREGLSFSFPKIYLHHTAVGSNQTFSDKEDWDDVLNFWLIDNHVKAITEENEKLRFALVLGRLLQRPEARFGEGYFNAVLTEIVTAAFSDDPSIAPMLTAIGPSKPHKGNSYSDAINMIELEFKECASLITKLGYNLETAKQIFAGAVAIYLDERFSITNARILGFL